MWFRPKVTIQPTNKIVTLDEVKRHVVVDFPDDDLYLVQLIDAATDAIEEYCSVAFVARTIVIEATSFNDVCRFPVGPIQSIVSVKYIDTDGVAQVVPSVDYEIRDNGIIPVYGKSWPVARNGGLVTIEAVAGDDAPPSSVKYAALLWVGDAYLNREDKPRSQWTGFDALLTNHRYYF